MSSNEDILELQQQITKSLAESGDLSRFKAELRSKIYGILKNEKKLENTNNQSITANEIGKMSLAVIYEFLEHFDLAYSLQVLSTETNTSPDQFEEKQMKLRTNNEPILYQLLKTSLQSSSLEDDIKTYDYSMSSK